MALSFARHDALFPLETLGIAPALIAWARLFARRRDPRRPGERLAAALQEMGPSFIKLGQALSTRADLLSEEVAADLARLQDHLPAFSGAEARAHHRGRARPADRCAVRAASTTCRSPPPRSPRSISPSPPTAARSRSRCCGPASSAAFARDLDLFYWMAELVERTQPRFRRLKPVESVQAFADVVRVEMDLRMEAAAAEELGENFADDPGYRAPADRLGPHRAARDDAGAGRRHPDRRPRRHHRRRPRSRRRHAKAAEAFFYQVFRDGFFHADMHGGNAFVDRQGRIVPVDFGIMGRIDADTRGYLAELLVAFLRRDYRAVAEVQFRAGYVPADQSLEMFAQACRSIGEPIFGKPSHEISIARLLAHLLRVTEQFEMTVQPQLLLLQKTMLMAEGMGTRLNPHVNIWELARPLIEEWMREPFRPARHDRARRRGPGAGPAPPAAPDRQPASRGRARAPQGRSRAAKRSRLPAAGPAPAASPKSSPCWP